MTEVGATRTCPCCKGGKVQHLTVHSITVDGRTTEHKDVPCIWCHGTGSVTGTVYQQWQFERNMWCKCGNPSGKTVFFNDGEHLEISKHHYRCYDCKKVTQIG